MNNEHVKSNYSQSFAESYLYKNEVNVNDVRDVNVDVNVMLIHSIRMVVIIGRGFLSPLFYEDLTLFYLPCFFS